MGLDATKSAAATARPCSADWGGAPKTKNQSASPCEWGPQARAKEGEGAVQGKALVRAGKARQVVVYQWHGSVPFDGEWNRE